MLTTIGTIAAGTFVVLAGLCMIVTVLAVSDHGDDLIGQGVPGVIYTAFLCGTGFLLAWLCHSLATILKTAVIASGIMSGLLVLAAAGEMVSRRDLRFLKYLLFLIGWLAFLAFSWVEFLAE
jgi:hypothetical protein